MKKLLAATLAVAFVFGAFGASAQTIAVSAVVGGEYSQTWDEPSPGQTTMIAVWIDTAGFNSNAAEFRVTEIGTLGFIKTNVAKINGTQLDLGNNSIGEYLLAFGGCEAASSALELVRVSYASFSADNIPPDYVLTIQGLIVGGDPPSSFGGVPGFVDCTQVKHTMVMGGADGGVTGSDTVFPDGSLVIDATPIAVDNDASSLGQLKARF